MERLFGEEVAPGARESGAAPREDGAGAEVPLATRMRPTTLDELVGQERLLGPGSALRRAIEEGHPHSMILHGPPGLGQDHAGPPGGRAPQTRRWRRRAPWRRGAPRCGR